MTDTRRRIGLFALLAVAVGWSGWLALSEQAAPPEVVEVADVRPPRTDRPVPATVAAPPANDPARVRLAGASVNLFPEQTWFVPPPPPPPPPPVVPPPPQAPALPFTYLGRWLEAGETTWYLNRGGTPLAVRAGQVVDGVWRLEPPRAGMLTFTYLPLNQTRSLRTGD